MTLYRPLDEPLVPWRFASNLKLEWGSIVIVVPPQQDSMTHLAVEDIFSVFETDGEAIAFPRILSKFLKVALS